MSGFLRPSSDAHMSNYFLQILSQASYGSEGITGLLQGDSNNRVGLTSSSSCPVVTQPRYRGGRKKEEAPPNMTPEQRVQWEKERQKKDNHNHSMHLP